MIQYTQQNRQARIDSPLGADTLLLESFAGSEKLSMGFEYNATVLSKEPSIDGNQIVGKKVTITYYDEDGRERYFNGHVSRFEYMRQVEQPAELTAYSLTMVPWMWFLNHNRDCQIHQEITVPDIIKTVFSDLGFTDYSMKLNGNYPEREYCVQYRETDFNFVSRLMEEEGIFYYYTHEKDKHTLVLCDDASGYFNLDEAEVQYQSRGQGQFKQLTDWRHVYEFRPGKVAQKDFNFKKPTDPLKVNENSQVKFENSDKLEVYEFPGLYEENGNGSRLMKIRLEELEAEHDHIEGSGHYLTFSPGGKFKVEKHSRAEDEGKTFVLTEVYVQLDSILGSDHGEADFHNEFRCIPADTVYRPTRRSVKPVVEGPQTAIVTTDGQEIVVDEFARVKVQFHWDRYGQKNIRSSCWIRVSQHHAGASWGMIDIPRKDEEVIVSFLEGDPDRPIITGRVYNGDNNPPFGLKGAGDNSKNKTRRGNTTKSYEAEGYNEFTMDDTAGKEQIRMHAQYDLDVAVLNDSRTHVFNNAHQIIGDGRGNGGDHFELVWNNQHANIKEHQVEHIEGNYQLTVGHGDTSGGRMDIVVENQEVKKVGSGGVHWDVDGPFISLIVGNEFREVGGDYMHKVAGKIGIESGMMQEIHVKSGSHIVLDAGAMGSVSINGPGGFIKIDQMGVTIQGMMVNINSGGAKQMGGGCTVESPETAELAAPTEPDDADRFKA